MGIPAIGFYAQVPHYASGAFPTAALELLKRVGQYLDLELPVGELPRQALETRSLLDAAVAGDERTSAYVKRLEQMSDEARLPSGDDLIADIERFLRDGRQRRRRRQPGRRPAELAVATTRGSATSTSAEPRTAISSAPRKPPAWSWLSRSVQIQPPSSPPTMPMMVVPSSPRAPAPARTSRRLRRPGSR